MNSLFAPFLLAAIFNGFNSPLEKATVSNKPSQVVKPTPKQKPVWTDRHNGRKYSLPTSIGEKPVSFYLKNQAVSPLAKALYTSRFRPTDNDSTTQLLALVTTNNKEIRPFYRWCLDFTIAISDGALGEYPGKPALAYATKFPQEFFVYMDKDITGERYKRWIEIIAYSGLNSYNETMAATRKRIVSNMTMHCQPCSAEAIRRINVLADDIANVVRKNIR